MTGDRRLQQVVQFERETQVQAEKDLRVALAQAATLAHTLVLAQGPPRSSTRPTKQLYCVLVHMTKGRALDIVQSKGKDFMPGGCYCIHHQYSPKVKSRYAGMLQQILLCKFSDDAQAVVTSITGRIREHSA
eukprot:1321116-Amphidinium_carterae.1